MTEAVRLVVWDLDETFWKGTLTEGGIQDYVHAHHDIVIELARRGIMSSICSKNTPEDVIPILEREGIADYFIFPSISWEPKGLRLAQLVETVQLRAATVMFIDDNPNNRGEAQAIVPGLQVEDETFIPRLLDDPRFKGKDDSKLSRLKQYKLLEERKRDEEQTTGGNEAFLRSCDVRIQIDYDVEANIDRAIELINRTNQLNFTKNRLPEDAEQARAMLRNDLASVFSAIGGLVRVADKYGDYGYIGFFLRVGIRRVVDGEIVPARLHHFCFSCRTLGMGIEQWVYQHLGRPEIRVVGDVLTDLSEQREIDWVRLVIDLAESDVKGEAVAPHIILHGGCETAVLSLYLQRYTPRLDVHGTYTANGIFVGGNVSAYVNNIPDRDPEEFGAECALLGLSPDAEIGDVFNESEPGAVFVANFSADAGGAFRIRHREKGWIFQASPDGLTGHFPLPAEDLRSQMDERPNHFTLLRRAEVLRINRHFANHYERMPWDEDERRAEEIRAIVARIPAESKFVLILPHDMERWDGVLSTKPEFTRYRDLARRVIAEYPFAETVFIGDVLESDDDILDINHYSRKTYARLAERIAAVAAQLPARAGKRPAPTRRIDRTQLNALLAPRPQVLDLSSAEIGDALVGRGWARAEHDGRWTLGDFSELQIPVERPGTFRLKILISIAYMFEAAPMSPSQELIVTNGSRQLLRTHIERHGTTVEFVVEPDDQRETNHHEKPGFGLMLLHPDACSPREIGRNSDSRRLSLMINKVTIEPL